MLSGEWGRIERSEEEYTDGSPGAPNHLLMGRWFIVGGVVVWG